VLVLLAISRAVRVVLSCIGWLINPWHLVADLKTLDTRTQSPM
jgi:hypothetical protein